HFMEELKRLGAGTLPASGTAKGAAPASAPVPRKPLAERLSAPRPPRAAQTASSSQPSVDASKAHDPERASGLRRALGGSGAGSTTDGSADGANGHGGDQAAGEPAKSEASADHAADKKKVAVRPRRLDRIAGLDKTSA